MNQVFAEGFDDVENYVEAPPSEIYAADWLANPHHIGLLAEIGGDPVGALAA